MALDKAPPKSDEEAIDSAFRKGYEESVRAKINEGDTSPAGLMSEAEKKRLTTPIAVTSPVPGRGTWGPMPTRPAKGE